MERRRRRKVKQLSDKNNAAQLSLCAKMCWGHPSQTNFFFFFWANTAASPAQPSNSSRPDCAYIASSSSRSHIPQFSSYWYSKVILSHRGMYISPAFSRLYAAPTQLKPDYMADWGSALLLPSFQRPRINTSHRKKGQRKDAGQVEMICINSGTKRLGNIFSSSSFLHNQLVKS